MRQAEVIFAIREMQYRDGIAPTMAELGQELGIDRSTIYIHLQMLKKHGYLTTMEGKCRSIRLTEAASMIPQPKKSRKQKAA